MVRFIVSVAGLCVSSTALMAGGWETGTLPTSMMYEDGNYFEFSYGSLNYNLDGVASVVLQASPTTELVAGQKHKMAKDQTRTSLAAKFSVGSYDVGISRFDNGAIQLDGTNSTVTSKTASADIKLTTMAIMGSRSLDNGMSVGLGMRNGQLGSGTVSTLAGVTYSVESATASSAIASIAYEKPEIALRAELVYEDSVGMPFDVTLSNGVTATGGLALPQSTTLNFQTGIATDTLLFGSVRNVAWSSSQVAVDAAVDLLDISSEFDNTTSYNVGVGRKLTEDLSASLSYAQEAGTGSTSTSGFTLTNGYNSLSAGLKYTIDNINISLGYSYVMPGDVTITHNVDADPSTDPATPATTLKTVYENSTVQALGIRIGVNF